MKKVGHRDTGTLIREMSLQIMPQPLTIMHV